MPLTRKPSAPRRIASIVGVTMLFVGLFLAVYFTCEAFLVQPPVWRHGDAAYWQRWLGEVCHAAEAKPHVNRFDGKLTIYETHWEAAPAVDAATAITAVDCTLTMSDGKHGPRTLVVLLTSTHTQLPGYAVMETTSAIARELTGDGAGVIMDLAAGPPRTVTRSKATFTGGYAQPWQWSMRVVLR